MFADNLKCRDLLLSFCNTHATLDTEMQFPRLARVSEKLGRAPLHCHHPSGGPAAQAAACVSAAHSLWAETVWATPDVKLCTGLYYPSQLRVSQVCDRTRR